MWTNARNGTKLTSAVPPHGNFLEVRCLVPTCRSPPALPCSPRPHCSRRAPRQRPCRRTHHSSERTCATATAGHAACLARVVTTDGHPLARKVGRNATPSGYGPADIRSAYNLGSASGAGRTVAIVDAYNDPTAEADLGVYRSQYGLPACTTANGCFRKVSQTGTTTLSRDRRRLGDRDQPRPRHGLRGVSGLQDPARRGQDLVVRQPRGRRELRGHAKAFPRSATATAAATARRVQRVQPPGHRDHRVDR